MIEEILKKLKAQYNFLQSIELPDSLSKKLNQASQEEQSEQQKNDINKSITLIIQLFFSWQIAWQQLSKKFNNEEKLIPFLKQAILKTMDDYNCQAIQLDEKDDFQKFLLTLSQLFDGNITGEDQQLELNFDHLFELLYDEVITKQLTQNTSDLFTRMINSTMQLPEKVEKEILRHQSMKNFIEVLGKPKLDPQVEIEKAKQKSEVEIKVLLEKIKQKSKVVYNEYKSGLKDYKKNKEDTPENLRYAISCMKRKIVFLQNLPDEGSKKEKNFDSLPKIHRK